MKVSKSLMVSLACFLTLAPLNAAQNQAASLAAQWEKAVAAKSSEADKLALAKQLLAYWDARLNSTYQRGLKQYPNSVSAYRNAQRKWLEYRDMALRIATDLGDTSHSERKMLSNGDLMSSSAYTALAAMLTMERVHDLLVIEAERSTYSEKDVEENFLSPLSAGQSKGLKDDDFGKVLSLAAEDAFTTYEINMVAGLSVDASIAKADCLTELLSFVVQSAQCDNKADVSECAAQLYSAFKECRKLNVAAIEAEYVQGMTGTIQVSIDSGICADAYDRYAAVLLILMKRDNCVFHGD